MCKKLMFLISCVCLLGWAGSALAADLEINWPDTYTCSGYEEWDEVKVNGTLVITATGHFVCLDESELDGNGDDGEGGTGATIIVNGGIFRCKARFNIGKDHDGYVYINDGGQFIQEGCGSDWDDGLKFPDDDGGEHRFFINEGTLKCWSIEYKDDRDAEFMVGCGGLAKIIVGDTGDDDRNPDYWESQGHLYCDPCCSAGTLLMINDLPDSEMCGDDWEDRKEVICFEVPNEAWGPNPADGATEIGRETCPLIVSWQPGAEITVPSKSRHLVFFGTDEDAVANSPTPFEPGFPGPEYQGYTLCDVLDYDLGTLPLWTEYFWRIDESPEVGSYAKGNVWKLTTGCTLIPGDINLDCVVNFLDYASLLTTWMDEQFFPDGCTPWSEETACD